jgi:lambda repressor-like predicted transcriptional regulator
MMSMSRNNGSNPATHFGKQMRKERLARGWSLREFSARSGVDFTTASRIENGKRPPNEKVATACDRIFPERDGWFSEYYEEMRGWSEVPASFRSWSELEDKAASLRDWSPGIVTGLLQTEGYARTLISVQPAITSEVLAGRLASRMDRQQRVLMRDDPPFACFILDELALYRCVGSPAVMAAQMRRLLAIASMPKVTVQVLPATEHPVNASGFLMADAAAWVEHAASGYVFTDEQTVSALAVRFDILRGECYRVSESLNLIERLGELWTTGASPLTRTATAGTA